MAIERPVRNNLRAQRLQGSRIGSIGANGIGGVGEAVAVGPLASDIGQAVIQKSEGENGSAIVALMFTSSLAGYIRDSDLNGFRNLGQIAQTTAEAMSKGPYSLRVLAAMNHPYAKHPQSAARAATVAKKGHAVPRFQPNKAIGHIKGIRGSVPTLAVTNLQSGNFAASWSYEVVRSAAGVSVILKNSAEYAFYLMDGTDKMLAHGPFEYVQRLMLPRFNAEWARVVTVAYQRMPKARAQRIEAAA